MPAFEAGAFVAETLESARCQSWRALRVLVSVDGSGDGGRTREACEPFTADPRFRVCVQPRRLGWVGNCNWLIGSVETPFFALVPHDDRLHERYVERLLGELRARPRAVVAFSDLRVTGVRGEFRLEEAGIEGEWLARALAYLVEHHVSVAFRGVTRTAAARAAGPVPDNDFESFGADAVWLFQLLRQGEFARLPEALYDKRLLPSSFHLPWFARPAEWKVAAWVDHCRRLGELALASAGDERERELLLAALLFRLAGQPAWVPFPEVRALPPERQRSLAADLVARLRGGGG